MTAVLLSFLLIGPVAVAPPVAPQSVACALTGPGMPFTLRRDALIGAGEMEEALRHVEDAIGREPQCAQHRSDAAVLLHAQGGDMRAALRYASEAVWMFPAAEDVASILRQVAAAAVRQRWWPDEAAHAPAAAGQLHGVVCSFIEFVCFMF